MQSKKHQDSRRNRKKIQKTVFLVLLVLFSITFGLVFWAPFTSNVYVKAFFEDEISSVLGAPVTFDRLDFDIFPAGLSLENIKLHQPVGTIKKLNIGSIDATFRLRGLLLGRVMVTYAEIVKPDLEFYVQSNSQQNAKDISFSVDQSTPVLIEDMQIKDARFKVSLPNQLSFTLLPDDIAFRQEGYSQLLKLNGKGLLSKYQSEQVVENVYLDVMKFRNQIFVQKFEVADQSNTIVSEGLIYPSLDFSTVYSGNMKKVDEVLTNLSIVEKSLGMGGEVFLESNLKGPVGDIRGIHDFTLKNVEVVGRKIGNIDAAIQTRNEFLSTSEIFLKHNQSDVKVSLTPTRRNNVLNYKVASDNLMFEDVLYWIDPVGEPVLYSGVRVASRGELSLKPFDVKGDLEVLFSNVTFNIPENVESFLPLEISDAYTECKFLWNQKDGIRFDEGTLTQESLDGDFYIYILENKTIEGNWEVAVKNFGSIFVEEYPVKGTGLVTGFIRQAGEQSRLEFDFDLANFEYANYGNHQFQGALSFLRDKVLFEDFLLTNAEKGSLEFHGEASATNETFELQSNFNKFNVGWVSEMVGRRYPQFDRLKGVGSGSLRLFGFDGGIDGEIALNTEEAFVFGVPVEGVDVLMAFEAQDMIIQKAEVIGSTLTASAKGTIGRESFDQVFVRAQKVPLEPMQVPSFFTSYVDTMDGELILNGSFEDPEIDISAKLFKEQEVLEKPYDDKARLTAKGTLSNLSWRMNTLEQGMQFEGKILENNQTEFEFNGTWEDFPILSVIENANSSITGFASGSGIAGDFSSWNIDVSLKELRIENDQVRFYNKTPFDLSMQKGNMQVNELTFGNETHEVKIVGGVSSDEKVSLALKGFLPFETLSILPLGLTRVEGVIELDLALGGFIESPIMQGNVFLKNGYLRHKNFPHPFEALELQASIDQNQLHASYIEAQIGGGTMTGEGDLFLSRSIEDMKIYMNGDVSQVNLRFPEYLPVLVEGPFSIEGDLNKPLLKTDLEVLSGMYTDDWNWQSQVLSFGDEKEAERIYRKEEESLLFDMRFYSVNENFLVRNDIAIAKVKGDITLRGSNRKFGMLGNIELIEGQVTFLENRFDMQPGVISFIRDDEIAMSFNLNARTRVENTDILLDIRTEQEEIKAFLSSIPQREETAIISLLTLGVELDDLAVSSGVNDGVSASIIPSVLSGPVQSRLQSGLKKIRLVDTFQFIPYFSEDTKTTGLKIFVAKNLFSKVRLTYSTDMFEAGNENTFTLEQFLSDNISLQGSFRDNKPEADQDVDLGLDFEFRTEF